MNKIISKEYFSANVVKFDVEAPLIAKARKAGHFVIVRTGEKGERIPLTITSSDPERGTISLVIQAVGKSTRKLCSLEAGDYITDVVGPLGQATHVEKSAQSFVAVGGRRRPSIAHRRSHEKSRKPGYYGIGCTHQRTDYPRRTSASLFR